MGAVEAGHTESDCRGHATDAHPVSAAARHPAGIAVWRGVRAGVVVLGALAFMAVLPSSAAIRTFDLNNCNSTHPCCINGDDVARFLGSTTRSFCKIEYPIRMEENWDADQALLMDKRAEELHKELTTKEMACDFEACKGYICAEMFPRCFYLKSEELGADGAPLPSTQMGSFVFETCKMTCEECFKTCATDLSARCGGKPDQFQTACTSGAPSALGDLSQLWLVSLVLLSLYVATL